MTDEHPYALWKCMPTVVDESGKFVGTFYWEMAVMHNCYLRGFNSTYINAPKVTPRDERSFMGYCLVMTQALTEHRDMEEEITFSVLEQKLDMYNNEKQHRSFLPQMIEFNEYCMKVKAKQEKYDATKFRTLLRGFADGCVQRLMDEIPTITPDKMHQFDQARSDKLIADIKARVKKASLLTVFPFTITNHDYGHVPRWPPAPAPIIWMVRNVFGRYNRNLWKFSTFDLRGNPQTYNG
ncbi:hypothetical protein IW261DRAFT_1448110 [Armillaria novae-zelandiae]|uniref:Hemerythrin-like domain-containing protein n=1 Tax=Armillaria novae-zelandiae TaxID=153914 RepID=A0AA39PQR9_9AGAR|nr:hypothetical protein IW261DRAFT_1448110 [Armillaria novae-zelandiae]